MPKKKSPLSIDLYYLMVKKGYPEAFAMLITDELNTDFTAKQMIGYLSHLERPSLEDVADEMLAIVEMRNRIMEKKINEAANARWNEYLNRDRSGDE
ncbi:MAG: hypothetical protein Q4C42_01445 [Clostridia bacterium]|nr:hypothetical protein [Clostridia bacterium]